MDETNTLTPDAIASLEDVALPPQPQLPAFHEQLKHVPVLTDTANAFLPVPLEMIRDVAAMIHAFPGVADKLPERGAVEALVLQAALWRVSPIYVADKAYQARKGGPLGYEAQLLQSVLLANGPFSRRPRLQYGYSDPNKRTAANLFCRASFFVIGEDEPITVTSPTVAQIKIKNSPLWLSDPQQQLGYYTFRNGGRLHFPDVLGGAYTREEVIHLRSVEPQAPRARPLFEEDEPQDAVFEGPEPTHGDEAAFSRWEKKASGEGDSRDPRDAPQNKPRGGPPAAQGPSAPPSGGVEPDGLQEAREWAANEQARLLALTDAAELQTGWQAFSRDKRFGRLRAYDQGVANAIRASIIDRGNVLLAAKVEE